MQTSEDSKQKNGKWQHLVDYCLDLYERIGKSEYRRKKIAEIKEANRIYEQEPEKTTFPWEDSSNIVLPLETITIDNLEPRLVSGIVGKEPFLKFDPEGEGELSEELQINEDWFNEEMKNVVRAPDVVRSCLHTQLIEGTVYPLPIYDIDETTRRDYLFIEGGQQPPEGTVVDQNSGMVFDAETGEAVTHDVVEPVFEGVKVEFINFNDVFVLDNTEDWEASPVMWHVRPTYAELMQAKGKAGYMNIGPWLVREQDDGDIQDEDKAPGQEDLKVSKKTIKCLMCSISYIYRTEDQKEEDATDFTEERVLALIELSRGVLIRLNLLREFNFKNEHFLKRIRLFAERGKAYGSGIHAKMKAIQKGASDTFNRVMNAADVAMIPWFLYSDKAGLNRDTKIFPGQGVKCDDPKEVVFPKFSVDPKQYIDFIYMFTSLWEKLVSIGDLQVGRVSDQKNTATEALAVIQEGNVKHNYQVKTYREEFLVLFRTIYDLYYQNMPFDKTVKVNGQEVPLNRRSMRTPYNFRLTGSTETANKLIERKEKEDLNTLLSREVIINPVTRIKKLLQSYGESDVNEWIMSTELGQIIGILTESPGLVPAVMETIQMTMDTARTMEEVSKDAEKVTT